MRTIIAILCWGVASLALAAGAATVPPVGQRAYVLDPDRHKPVTIERSDAARGRYLKDPVQPGSVRPAPVAKPAPKPVAKPAPAKPKAGQLRFKAMVVKGHLKQPRVEFTRALLPMDRADEPVTQDFFQKVFEPALDDGF